LINVRRADESRPLQKEVALMKRIVLLVVVALVMAAMMVAAAGAAFAQPTFVPNSGCEVVRDNPAPGSGTTIITSGGPVVCAPGGPTGPPQ
jgi:hypothetical protein